MTKDSRHAMHTQDSREESRETVGSHVQASMAQSPVHDARRLVRRLVKHPGLGHSLFISPHSLATCICTLAVSYRFLFYFVHCSIILLHRSFFLHISRLAFPPFFCLFPKHPQRLSPAFSTFKLPAAPYYAADIQRKRLCLATGLNTS